MEPVDPTPKKYGFKPREFAQLNTPVVAEPSATASAENDIHAILRHNHDAAKAAGLNEVVIKKVKSRRARDYWTLLAAMAFAIFCAVAVTKFNPGSILIGLAGMAMFTLAATWVMWFVMDKY
jgi:hypothetical protein